MKFYELNTLGNANGLEYCIIEDLPDGMGMKDYYLSTGEEAKDYYPDNAVIPMTDENPGTTICDLLGNTRNCLTGTEKLKTLIEQHCEDQKIEFLNFTLYDHNGNPHRNDLYFINPIGGYDCLNIEASGVIYEDDGDVDEVEEITLSPDKLKGAPALFRVLEDPMVYVIREDFLKALQAENIENVIVNELPLE